MTRPSVVLLPGLMCDRSVWAAQEKALDFAECFVPTYGTIDSIEQMARFVLDAAPSWSFSLAGHSMGGRVALEMIRIAPERIERLALLDTGMAPRPQDDAGELERSNRMALLALARSRGMREMGLQWARGMVHPSRLQSPLFDAILDMLERSSPQAFEAQINALLSRPDARGVLEEVRCPTVFVCGRQDAWSPLQRHQEMHALLPGSQLVVIEDSGHMTPMEQPEAVSRALRQWLQADRHE
jgi:pimeloyl-ACP methyl ester carboxylesterase